MVQEQYGNSLVKFWVHLSPLTSLGFLILSVSFHILVSLTVRTQDFIIVRLQIYRQLAALKEPDEMGAKVNAGGKTNLYYLSV